VALQHFERCDLPAPPKSQAALNFSENNFDLIRLVAASEVAIRHAVHHITPERETGPLFWLLDMIPGVPIFFFLSGYLISRSWERSPSPSNYFRNRALRLFPALWFCTAASLVMLFASGFMGTIEWKLPQLLVWIGCQTTVFQFWNPEIFRGFGAGVVNGSLWTISVEIQFYVILAVLYRALKNLTASQFNGVLVVLVVLFGAVNQWKSDLEQTLSTTFSSPIAGKMLLASFIPWIYMFLLGVLAQRHAIQLVPFVSRYRMAILVSTCSCLFLCKHLIGLPVGNYLPALLVPLLGCGVLVCGYTMPTLSHRILGRNDCSYGIYIYHMPLVNLALWLGGSGSVAAIGFVLLSTAGLSLFSWRVVERPFLSRKRSALRVV
jgi:peptidoglycan/LPS O-acetylase OafA/YrhL